MFDYFYYLFLFFYSSTKTQGFNLHLWGERSTEATPISVRVSPPYNIWINTQAIYRPLSFSTWSPHSKCGLACSQQSGEPQLVSFSIHVFTQNSVKAAKAVNTANWGSLGNRSRPISSFINQSTLLDLDGEQCPWNGTPSILPLDANAMAALARVHACVRLCRCAGNSMCTRTHLCAAARLCQT